jgi:DDE superfamily endonuclease
LRRARSQQWQALGVDEQFDAAGDARSASDQAGALDGEDHLVDRRRCDLEMATGYVVHPQIEGTYVARMEDVLDLYAETPDAKRPVVCFDESPTQLIGEVRQPIPAAPGQLERYDCEYRRNGTANLFVFLDAHRPWRTVKVTDNRTSRDFAECMRDLVDLHYPKAQLIRVVLDNLSSRSPSALYEAFPAPEAHRILRRLEFHYTPKHASE